MNLQYCYIYILLFLIIATSCVNGGNKSGTVVEKKENGFIAATQMAEIDLQKDYPKKKLLLDEIADIEYIPLETRDSVLLGMLFKFAVSDSLIVIADMEQETVFFFNRQGKFIHSFNHKGQGDKEYIQLGAMCADFVEEEVFIYDHPLRYRIMVYSFDGEFKRELKLNGPKRWVQSLYPYDEIHLISYDICRENYKNPTDEMFNRYPYFLIDKQSGKISSLLFEVDNRITNAKEWSLEDDDMISINLGIKNWRKADKGVYISDFALDTIYHCTGDEFIPKAVRKNHPGKGKFLSSLCLESKKYSFFKRVKWAIDDSWSYDYAIENLKGNGKEENVLVFDKQTAVLYEAFVTMKDFSEKSQIPIERYCDSDVPEDYYVDLLASE